MGSPLSGASANHSVVALQEQSADFCINRGPEGALATSRLVEELINRLPLNSSVSTFKTIADLASKHASDIYNQCPSGDNRYNLIVPIEDAVWEKFDDHNRHNLSFHQDRFKVLFNLQSELLQLRSRP